MKKRLLITSIVMMLVVAVALSTATYAWFTSNNSVTASDIVMTASSSQTASIAIAWVPTSAEPTFSSSIESDPINSSTTFSPVAPTTVTSSTTFANFTFASSTIKTINGLNYFNSTPEATAPTANADAYVWTGLSGTSTTMRLKNMSATATSRNIWVKATIGDDDSNNDTENGISLIRVAIFKADALVGIMANSADVIAYGTIATPSATPTNAETAEALMHISSNTTSATAAATGLDLGTLTAGGTMDIRVVVWMDGQALGDAQGGRGASVSLTFEEAAATPAQGG